MEIIGLELLPVTCCRSAELTVEAYPHLKTFMPNGTLREQQALFMSDEYCMLMS